MYLRARQDGSALLAVSPRLLLLPCRRRRDDPARHRVRGGAVDLVEGEDRDDGEGGGEQEEGEAGAGVRVAGGALVVQGRALLLLPLRLRR